MRFTLPQPAVFPDGTTVGAYPVTNFPAVPAQPSGKPVGEAASEGKVEGDAITFTGLFVGQSYWAVGNVGTEEAPEYRYVRFTAASEGTKRVIVPLSGRKQFNGDHTNFSQRQLIALPAVPTRFRLRMRNRDPKAGTEPAGVVTCKGVYIGIPAYTGTDSFWEGDLTEAPTEVLGEVALLEGEDLVTGWIDASALGIVAGVPFALCMGFTTPEGVEVVFEGATEGVKAGNWSFWTSDWEDASDLDIEPSHSRSALDIRVEADVEVPADTPLVVVLGTSIDQGSWGTAGRGPVPMHKRWPEAAGLRNGLLVTNLGIGSASYGEEDSQDAESWRYERADLVNNVPDIAILGGATNDLSGVSVEETKERYKAVIDMLRELGIDRIYANTLIPTEGGGVESKRLEVNDWLRTSPYGIEGVIEMAKPLEVPGTSEPREADPDYLTEPPHPNPSGYQRMAAEVPALRVLTG
jgi:lysophospholipase L1-like esterase